MLSVLRFALKVPQKLPLLLQDLRNAGFTATRDPLKTETATNRLFQKAIDYPSLASFELLPDYMSSWIGHKLKWGRMKDLHLRLDATVLKDVKPCSWALSRGIMLFLFPVAWVKLMRQKMEPHHGNAPWSLLYQSRVITFILKRQFSLV